MRRHAKSDTQGLNLCSCRHRESIGHTLCVRTAKVAVRTFSLPRYTSPCCRSPETLHTPCAFRAVSAGSPSCGPCQQNAPLRRREPPKRCFLRKKGRLRALFVSNSQNFVCAASQSFSSLMGTRTCSMVSRSRMVTALSAGVLSSPTVAKSTVMQYGVPISSSRR